MNLLRAHHTFDCKIYATHSLTDGTIASGYEILVGKLTDKKVILPEGYVGVDWEEAIHLLLFNFKAKGVSVTTHDVSACYRKSSGIEVMIKPFKGRDNPIFRRKTSFSLHDFIDSNQALKISLNQDVDVNVNFASSSCLLLVEGTVVNLEVNTSEKSTFSYAETFIVTAAANSYTLSSLGSGIAKVVVAYIKDEAC